MSVPDRAEGSVLRACASARSVELDALAPPGGLMIVSPHPDDETLGCGQALAAAAKAGRDIVVILLTDGEASRSDCDEVERNRLVALRRDELQDALSILAPGRRIRVQRMQLPDGCSAPCMLDTGRFENMLDMARAMDCASIWSTWRGDQHCDHRTAATIGRRLAERLEIPFWSFPVWGRFGERAVGGDPRLFDHEPTAHRKRHAIQCYASQIDGEPLAHPDDFIMPPELVEHFAEHPEIFFRER